MLLVERDAERVAQLNRGESYIEDVSSEALKRLVDGHGRARRPTGSERPADRARRLGLLELQDDRGARAPRRPLLDRRQPAGTRHWRHHAFITDRPEPLAQVEADHRRHAQIELAIRDLKQGSGPNHAPSGRFFANAAWLLVACLAHNLARWLGQLGLHVHGPIVAQTLRRRYLTLPGRITRSARRSTLHLPARWPWRESFTQALARLRALPLLA